MLNALYLVFFLIIFVHYAVNHLGNWIIYRFLWRVTVADSVIKRYVFSLNLANNLSLSAHSLQLLPYQYMYK